MAKFVSPAEAVMLGYVHHMGYRANMDQIREDERFSSTAKGLAEKLYKGNTNKK